MRINNGEEHYLKAPSIGVERSTFHRIFRNLTTFNAGQLIPIWVDQKVSFGDTIKASVASVIRMATPLNPTMDNMRVDIYAYSVPIIQIWKHLKEFHGENTIGAWKDTRNFEIPQIKVKWIKGLGGSSPVKVQYNLTRPMGGGVEETIWLTGTGSSLNQAVQKSTWNGVFYVSDWVDDIDIADANPLKKYYKHGSILDYMGIPDLGFNHSFNTSFSATSGGITTTIDYSTSPITVTVNKVLPTGTDPIEFTLSGVIKDISDGINAVTALNTNLVIEKEISALPLRAYQLIYDQAFRNQNYIEPVDVETYNGDATIELGDLPYQGGLPARVNRCADYFSTCLPEPQKGDAVLTPIGTSAPVVGTGKAIGFDNGGGEFGLFTGTSSVTGLGTVGTARMNTGAYNKPLGTAITSGNIGTAPTVGYVMGLSLDPEKSGLIADLSQAVAATINAQRLAFATQRILEKDARGGTRFQEIAAQHFQIDYINPLEIQVPEYLGGESIPISISQVNQTSQTATTPLGDTGANSLTAFSKQLFTKSFLQPTIVMLLAAIRTDRTYCQGIHRDWFKKKRLEEYYPALAHLGEQPVYNREIYADGSTTDDEVWGYQERWAELKTGWRICTGAMKPTYAETLDVWHYADVYGNLPVMSKDWLQEDSKRINRTLVYSDEVADQFISDWELDTYYTRPMPTYSIPGLIDHY